MINFNENNQSEIANFVLRCLSRHKQFALGTTDESGHPWVICLNFAFDEKTNFIWKSRFDTEHSRHILKNPNVAICVFSESKENGDFGFYAKAVAHQVVDRNELKECLDVRYWQKGKEPPPLTDFLENAPNRIYYAELREAWVNDDRHLKVGVDLDALRNIVKKKL